MDEEPSKSKVGSPRHRRRRSRDRSRSRDRKRRRRHDSRSRHKDSDHEHDSEDSSSNRSRRKRHRRSPESSQRRRSGGETPDQTIMLRGLTPDITEEDIRSALLSSKLKPKEIRLMRYKNGVSRGFAFVEFHILADAVRWKELTQGEVVLREVKASLYYSIRENIHGDRASSRIQLLDWNCFKCGVVNFKRRMQCFKCFYPRELSQVEPASGDTSLGSNSTDRSTLVLSNLSPLTTEETVLATLGQFTQLPIKALHLVRQLPNIRCLVEMNSAADATQLHDLLHAASPLTIDAATVVVTYAKKSLSYKKSVSTANVASAALAAAQWTNHADNIPPHPNSAVKMQERATIPLKNLGTVTVNGVSYPQYPSPDVSTFQYDQTSGFYYDSQTGLYYDASSQYFYHPETQKYMYWDGEHRTYLPAATDTGESSTISSSAVVSAGPVLTAVKQKSDKNKVAKKIAKDMEKWAKAMNTKKEGGVSRPVEQLAEGAAREEELIRKPDSLAGLVAAYGDSDSEDDKALEAWSQELAGLIDWEKRVCRLCKRQFHTKDLLTKHQQLSSLHLQNLAALKSSKLTSLQIEELDQREAGYRDRAKERREKFGLPKQPQTNSLKEHYMKQLEIINQEEPANQKIGSDNIGSRMLKAMGWSEGQGLGKDNQGTSSIIEVTSRARCAGLGTKTETPMATTPFDYRQNGKKIMMARYQEMVANE